MGSCWKTTLFLGRIAGSLGTQWITGWRQGDESLYEPQQRADRETAHAQQAMDRQCDSNVWHEQVRKFSFKMFWENCYKSVHKTFANNWRAVINISLWKLIKHFCPHTGIHTVKLRDVQSRDNLNSFNTNKSFCKAMCSFVFYCYSREKSIIIRLCFSFWGNTGDGCILK